ncbi:hypothetical protein [Streptomyces sp. NPDC046821]|uniref:hypothetical protein n=1 Tax=Streptomyces sp. NPDC046821 TaxID=3154702 RepID=UPI0034093CE4
MLLTDLRPSDPFVALGADTDDRGLVLDQGEHGGDGPLMTLAVDFGELPTGTHDAGTTALPTPPPVPVTPRGLHQLTYLDG